MTIHQDKPSKNSRNVAVSIFCIFIALTALSAFYPSRHPEGGTFDSGSIAFMLSASGLVLLMTPGLSFFYGGMVNSRSIISTMLQSFVALGIVSLLWYVVGFSLAFGDDIGGVIAIQIEPHGDSRGFLAHALGGDECRSGQRRFEQHARAETALAVEDRAVQRRHTVA
mgnify:CR=1 FL=1